MTGEAQFFPGRYHIRWCLVKISIAEEQMALSNVHPEWDRMRYVVDETKICSRAKRMQHSYCLVMSECRYKRLNHSDPQLVSFILAGLVKKIGGN